MPKNVLPEAARVLPKAGQGVWMKAFNEALDQGLGEEEASKMAWAAVKRAGYSKSNGKWSKSMDMISTDFALSDDGSSFELGVPLIKIDVKKRIVGGFATLDNVDEAGDMLDASASKEAFGSWFGNIREMHQKEAVGKAIDWKPDTYTDPETGIEYDGIWVNAKISKGAESTWQKVLDGTLGGFSVGGATLEKERALVKDGDDSRQVWKITKYKLTELSLVDNPCNRFATVSLVKSIDGAVEVDETVADGDLEKAYNGETGEFADLSESYKSVVRALEALRNDAIGVNDDGTVACVSETLGTYRMKARWETSDAEYAMNKSEDQEEKTMTEEITKSEDEKVAETVTPEDSLNKEDSATNSGDELTEDEKSVFRKFLEFVKGNTVVEEATGPSLEGELDMKDEDVKKAIDEAGEELVKGVDSKFDALGESLTKITTILEKVATAEAVDELKKDFESKLDALTARVETVESTGGLKKSGETDGAKPEDKIEKSEGLWGGNILPEFLLNKG